MLGDRLRIVISGSLSSSCARDQILTRCGSAFASARQELSVLKLRIDSLAKSEVVAALHAPLHHTRDISVERVFQRLTLSSLAVAIHFASGETAMVLIEFFSGSRLVLSDDCGLTPSDVKIYMSDKIHLCTLLANDAHTHGLCTQHKVGPAHVSLGICSRNKKCPSMIFRELRPIRQE